MTDVGAMKQRINKVVVLEDEGWVLVLDQNGQQIPELQGTRATVLERVKELAPLGTIFEKRRALGLPSQIGWMV